MDVCVQLTPRASHLQEVEESLVEEAVEQVLHCTALTATAFNMTETLRTLCHAVQTALRLCYFISVRQTHNVHIETGGRPDGDVLHANRQHMGQVADLE